MSSADASSANKGSDDAAANDSGAAATFSKTQPCVVCKAISAQCCPACARVTPTEDRRTFYCSKACQTKHWKGGHKQVCAALQEATAAETKAAAEGKPAPKERVYCVGCDFGCALSQFTFEQLQVEKRKRLCKRCFKSETNCAVRAS
jgi:hypothetical protein